MRNKLKICVVLALVVLTLISSVAFAKDGSFDFTFRNNTGTDDSAYGYRTAAKGTGKTWYLTIKAGSGNTAISKSNILGLRPRKGLVNNDGVLGPYRTYTGSCTDMKHSYDSNVATGSGYPVILRGKRDSASTSQYVLTVTGSYEP